MNIKRSVFFIEGLPGSGKTTVSGWLNKEIGGTLILESAPNNPNNFFEIAGIPLDSYSEIIGTYPEITGFTKQIDTYKYVNIGEVKKHYSNNTELISMLSQWDIGDEYNTNINCSHFATYTLPRISAWVRSIEDWQTPIIMDSMWLQNPINEMLFRNANANAIDEYCSLIAESFSDYQITCIYLKHRNVTEGIEFASKVKGEHWTTRVTDAICKTPYGITNNLQGFDGLVRYFYKRAEIEERILSQNIVNHYEYIIDDYDWDTVREKIRRNLLWIYENMGDR